MKKTMLVTMLFLLTAGICYAQNYDDYGYRDNTVRQQYNPMEDRWETVQGQKDLKYNSFEDEWSYQDRDAQPTYNSFEDKWEYPR